MRILINTASNCASGGVQVAKSIIEECLEFPDHEFLVVLSAALAPFFPYEKKGKVEFRSLSYRPVQRLYRFRSPSADLQRFEDYFRPDVVFTTSGPAYWRPKSPHLVGFNLAHNVYSDSPFFSGLAWPHRLEWFTKKLSIRYFMLRDADAWVVQTDDINLRLRKWLKRENVYTVSNTASSHYREYALRTQPSARDRSSSAPFQILVLSSYFLHKNLELVNDICNLMRDKGITDIRFTMTLPEDDFDRVIESQNREFVSNVGKQRPQDCPQLYLDSHALFLPTLLECFSANYVEAMCMGRPIVTTDMGFARTICGDAALYFEPRNPSDALDRIVALKSSTELYRMLVAAGKKILPRFGTPKQRLEKYIQIFRELVASRGG
jgi:glycosyltransferase involved in cell wall biosynthesis